MLLHSGCSPRHQLFSSIYKYNFRTLLTFLDTFEAALAFAEICHQHVLLFLLKLVVGLNFCGLFVAAYQLKVYCC